MVLTIGTPKAQGAEGGKLKYERKIDQINSD